MQRREHNIRYNSAEHNLGSDHRMIKARIRINTVRERRKRIQNTKKTTGYCRNKTKKNRV